MSEWFGMIKEAAFLLGISLIFTWFCVPAYSENHSTVQGNLPQPSGAEVNGNTITFPNQEPASSSTNSLDTSGPSASSWEQSYLSSSALPTTAGSSVQSAGPYRFNPEPTPRFEGSVSGTWTSSVYTAELNSVTWNSPSYTAVSSPQTAVAVSAKK